jgi:hypothetical protein
MLDGQRIDRTPLTEREARMGVATRIQHNTRVRGIAERVDRALRHVETTHGEWRADALANPPRTSQSRGPDAIPPINQFAVLDSYSSLMLTLNNLY